METKARFFDITIKRIKGIIRSSGEVIISRKISWRETINGRRGKRGKKGKKGKGGKIRKNWEKNNRITSSTAKGKNRINDLGNRCRGNVY